MTLRSTAPGHPVSGTSTQGCTGLVTRRPGPWRLLAGVELSVASVVVLFDWITPSLVLAAMAGVSLIIRRDGPSSLGFHRPAHPWRLAGEMFVVALGLSLLDIGLLMPIANHVSGRHQDVGGFADVEGNLALLALFVVLGWTLAAFLEEVAFRGYLLTRTVELIGDYRPGFVAGLVGTAVLFGAIHAEQGLVGMVVAGVDGLLYGVLRWWKNTLWGPILAHGFVDTIGFVAFYFVGPTYGLW